MCWSSLVTAEFNYLRKYYSPRKKCASYPIHYSLAGQLYGIMLATHYALVGQLYTTLLAIHYELVWILYSSFLPIHYVLVGQLYSSLLAIQYELVLQLYTTLLAIYYALVGQLYSSLLAIHYALVALGPHSSLFIWGHRCYRDAKLDPFDHQINTLLTTKILLKR